MARKRDVCNIPKKTFETCFVQGKQLGKLLDEDPEIMQRRVSLAKRLELYRSAQSEIDTVAWAK